MNRNHLSRPKPLTPFDYERAFHEGSQSIFPRTSTTGSPATPQRSSQPVPAPPPSSTSASLSSSSSSSLSSSSATSSASSTSSTSSSVPFNPSPCSFTTTDGRRCRMFRSPDHPALCHHHAEKELRALDRAPVLPLAAHLLGPLQDFRSATAINAVMGNAFVQLADGRLDPQRAAILTYMAQLMMQTLRKVNWEGIDNQPAPNLQKARAATLKASVPKSQAEKLMRMLYAAALKEHGPGDTTT